MVYSARPPSGAFLISLAVLLAGLHATLAVTATAEKSMTADEIGHLTAGQAYNTRADYRLQPENGNLPQRWAALPMTLAQVPLPPPDLAAWQTADVWKYGHAFFYEQGFSSGEFLFLGRAMIALVSAATGLLVFFWSRALFGWRGAFLSLTLFAFCPAFLAHGALATSDAMVTFFFLASVGAWWRHLQKPGASGTALSAVVLGLAFVAKFSAILLLPMLALIALAWAAGEARTTGWRRPLGRLIRTTLVHVVAVWCVIWMFYGLRFSAFAPAFAGDADFNHSWSWMLEGLGWPGKIIAAFRDWRILPEAWLYGLAFVLGFSEARGAFLNGDYRLTGWVSFFPLAFLVKTTLPLLLLVAVSAVAAVRKMIASRATIVVARLRPFMPLAALFGIYWATSLASHLNIGHRHILPTYPVLFICAGWLGRWLDFRRPLAAMLVFALAAWHIGESAGIRPHYLAYFNQLAGGPANGWRHLVDSSLDWGQDLPGLAAWLKQNNPRAKAPVFLAYFGTGEPDYEGIVATRLYSLPDFGRTHSWRPLTAGIYCVSATMLQQVYSDQHQWTLALEWEYQALRSFESSFFADAKDPARPTELTQNFPAERRLRFWKRYELLRFARLCYYLQVRTADANAGYSILIFRLSAAEVSAATAGSLADWRMLMEQAVASRRR